MLLNKSTENAIWPEEFFRCTYQRSPNRVKEELKKLKKFNSYSYQTTAPSSGSLKSLLRIIFIAAATFSFYYVLITVLSSSEHCVACDTAERNSCLRLVLIRRNLPA